MTYAVTIDVQAPVAMYRDMHQRLLELTGGKADGLLVHLARPVADGFQILEVWRDRAAYDRYNDEIIAPLMAEVVASGAGPRIGMSTSGFEPSGLVIPDAGVAV
jgi:hypothetical protein